MTAYKSGARRGLATVALMTVVLLSSIANPRWFAQAPPQSASKQSDATAKATNQPAPAKTDTAEKSLFEKIFACVAVVRGGIVDIVVIGAVIFFGKAVWTELRSGSTIIDPIEVPKDLSEQGYTPQVIAQRLHSEIATLARANKSRAALSEGFELGGSQIDFAVPSAGVSFRNVIRYLRLYIGRPEEHLRGEIIRDDEVTPSHLIASPVESSNFSQGSSAADLQKASGSLRIQLRMSDGRATSPKLSVEHTAALPELIRDAAFAAADIADPYILATYWFDKEQKSRNFPKTMRAIRRCFSSTSALKHHRAYVIWGDVFASQRNYENAEEKYRSALTLAPNEINGYLRLGNLFRVQRRYDDAFDVYKEAANRKPKDAASMSSLGYICNDRHQYTEALPYFRTALRLDPRHVNSLNGIGFALWKLNQNDDAKAAFSRATDIEPRYGWPYRHQAGMLRSQRKYKEAIGYLETAATTDIAAEAYAAWGDTLLDRGEFADARAMYVRAGESDPTLPRQLAGEARLFSVQHQLREAIEVSDETIRRDPFHVPARLMKADALRRLGQVDDSVQTCSDLIGLDRYVASAYVHWGIAIQSKTPDKALSLFQKAVSFDPAETWARRSCADELMRRHRYRAAIANYTKALESDPADSSAHVGWGHALSSMGCRREAMDHFRLAYQLDGRNGAALRHLAAEDLRLGRTCEALVKFRNAVGAWPCIVALRIEQGNFLQQLGFVTEALTSFDCALSLNPRDPDALVGKANTLRRLRRYDEACVLLRKAITSEPIHNAAGRTLAFVLRERGDRELAFEEISAAHARDSYNADVLFSWGGLLERDGRHDEAEAKYRRVIAHNRSEVRSRLALGQSQLNRYRPEKAIRQFGGAARADRFDPEPQIRMAQALEAMHKYGSAIRRYREATKLRPADSTAYVGWGNMLWRMGHPEAALRLYRQAQDADRRNSAALQRRLDLLVYLRRYDEALEIVNAVTAMDPPISDFLVVAGHIQRRLGHLEDAKLVYRRALQMVPADSAALIGFAETLDHRYDESSIRILRYAPRSGSSQAWSLRLAGERLRRRARADEGLRLFENVFEDNPAEAQALIDAADLLVLMAEDAGREASSARKIKDESAVVTKMGMRVAFFANADQKLHIAAALDPWDANIRRRQGMIAMKTEKLNEALQHFKEAVRLDRYNWDADLGQCETLFRLKDRRKAIKVARRVASRHRQDVIVLLKAADMLKDFNEIVEARNIWNEASSLASTDALRAFIDERLEANQP